jgi:flagellar biosynthetic protein FliR
MSRLPTEMTLSTVIVGSVGELMIGLIIGLGMTVIISGAELAGTLVGQQAGIALASVIDPTQGESSTVVGQVFVITMTLIFLVIGGHRDMAMALLDTFDVVPVLSFTVDASIGTLMADLLTASFILGIKLFSPVLIALLLVTIVMGFLSRTIPQLNILSVGFVVRSLAALGMAALALAASRELLVDALLDGMEWIRVALGLSPTHISG